MSTPEPPAAPRPLPGVHRVRLGIDADEIVRRARAGGWRAELIDGRRATNREDLFDLLAATLGFPAYFGRNWDAVVDCLRELAGEGLSIVVDHAEFLGAPGDTLAEIVDELADSEDLPLALCLRSRPKGFRSAGSPRP